MTTKENDSEPDGMCVAELAQVEASGGGGPEYDPARCAAKRCKKAPVITHLGRPLCQTHWDQHCREEEAGKVSNPTGDACCPVDDRETLEEESHYAALRGAVVCAPRDDTT